MLTVIGMLIVVLGIYFLSSINIEVSFFKISLILAILGFGIGTTFPTMSKAIVNSAPLSQIGSSVGTFNMIRNLGGPFGIAISATIFAKKMAYYVAINQNKEIISAVKNINQPFYEVGLVLLCISMIGVISAFFVKSKSTFKKEVIN
jgi:hypothetical protein